MTIELEALPETLRMFREGVSNFQRITKRLLDATDAIEQIAQFSAGGLVDTRRRIEEVNRLLQQQVASPSREMVSSAVSELSDTLSSLARLNPLWPRPPSSPDHPAGSSTSGRPPTGK